MNLKFFNAIVSPGVIPETIAIIGSFIAMLVIFPLDIITGSEISLHILYIFPLIIISMHCSRSDILFVAVCLSILLQAYTLITYDNLSGTTKLLIVFMILLSNATIALTARLARTNYLKYKILSTADPLTNLCNRRALDIAIERETERQKRYGGTFSIALIDLDGFKGLNDSMGHLAGDKALQLVGEVLSENTRQTDTISRIGGDEFVILMPNTEKADCEALCQSLCSKIANRMADASFEITASIGCTTFTQPPEFQSDILHKADKAMYLAKGNGKCCVVCI